VNVQLAESRVSEATVLRWCIEHPDDYAMVASRMADYHVHYPPWKIVWRALAGLYKNHGTFPTLPELKRILSREVKFDPATMAHLLGEVDFLYAVPISEISGEEVRVFVASRELLEIGAVASALAMNPEKMREDTPKLLRRVEDLAMMSGKRPSQGRTFSPFDLKDIQDVKGFFEEMYGGGGVIPTGLARVDERLKGGGMQAHLTLLIGPTGGGKSTLALNVALHNLRLGKRVVYLALDDSRGELLERVASHLLKTDITEVDWDLPTFQNNIAEVLADYPGDWHGEELNPDDFTPEDVAGHLKMLQYSFARKDRKNGVPEDLCGHIDLVVIDSGDQLKSGAKNDDWNSLSKMFERANIIPKRFGCNLTMTVQGNQETVGAGQITVRNVGGAYGKAKPAKLILGFAQTILQRHDRIFINWDDEQVRARIRDMHCVNRQRDLNTPFQPGWLCIMKNTRARSVSGPASWVKLPLLVDYSTCRVVENYALPEELIVEDKKTKREENEANAGGATVPPAQRAGKRGAK
jgi:hypothetical protein